MNFTVSVNIISDLVNYLCENNADRSYLLSLLNTTDEFLMGNHNRLSADYCEEMWQYEEELTGDQCVGIHCGERKNNAALGLISPLILSCADILTAVEKTSSYMNIISDAQRIDSKISGGEFIINFNPHNDWIAKHPKGYKQIMACTVAFAVKTIGTLAGAKISPQKAYFNYELTTEIQKEYERVLECPVGYDPFTCKLVYDKKYAYYPIQSRNTELMELIEQHIVESMNKYSLDISFKNKVKQLIIEGFKKGTPTINFVSKAMGLSTRNLQRKLKEEEASFQDLIKEIKKDMAESYLKNDSLTISEISYMLGYAEPAVFTRAYKKWTGFSPERARSKVYA